MAVQQNRKTSSRRDMRRSHDKLKNPALSDDPVSGETHLRHRVTPDGLASRLSTSRSKTTTNRRKQLRPGAD